MKENLLRFNLNYRDLQEKTSVVELEWDFLAAGDYCSRNQKMGSFSC